MSDLSEMRRRCQDIQRKTKTGQHDLAQEEMFGLWLPVYHL